RVAAPMNEDTKGLSDDDLQNMAIMLSKLPPPGPPAEATDPQSLARGHALAEQNHCNVCHRSDFTGQSLTFSHTTDESPTLAACTHKNHTHAWPRIGAAHCGLVAIPALLNKLMRVHARRFKRLTVHREGYDETRDSHLRVPNGGCRPRGLDRG